MHSEVVTVCVVTPCYNEELGIGRFHERLKAVLTRISNIEYEVIFVDDGSSDATLERLNELAAEDGRLTVLSLSRNFGHQTALTAGIDHADADIVILMDSDLQHPPELLPDLIQSWHEGDHDVVSAVRGRTTGASPLKRLTSYGFYAILNLLSETKITPGAADFCLLSRRAQAALKRMPERHRFLRGMISWIGFKRAFVPYEASDRSAGSSKYTFKRMIALAADAAFSFSAAPIRLGIRLGLAVVGLGSFYFAYILARAFFFGDLVHGWGSLMSVLLILGGLNLTLVGLVGSYVARVYEEVKDRPLYFLKQGPSTFVSHGGKQKQPSDERNALGSKPP